MAEDSANLIGRQGRTNKSVTKEQLALTETGKTYRNDFEREHFANACMSSLTWKKRLGEKNVGVS